MILMLNNKKIFLLLLAFIFVFGLFLRVYKLEKIPAGFQVDEASKGYSAYSLLRTGKDDNNNFLPITIDVFGDNSPAGYHYITVPSVALFGLNEFAVRFPGALFGSLTIISFYFLAFSLSKNKKISLLSALFLAISPWHINLSRASSESLVSLFFVITGFSIIIYSHYSENIRYLILGSLLLIASFFFYQTPRLFVPVFFLVLIVFLLKIKKIKIKTSYGKSLIGTFLFLSLIVFILFFVIPGGNGRFNQVNIFNYPETRLVMEEQIRESGVAGTNVIVTRLFHNKLINYPLSYLSNYLEYFSGNFLFIKGLPYFYLIPNMGVLYLIELPFILFGIYFILKSKNSIYKLILLWLVLGPAAAAITIETNNLQRSLVTYPMFELITSFGIIGFITYLKNYSKLLIFIITVFLFFNFSYFLHQYFVIAPVHQTIYRNNGFSRMIEYVNRDYNKYDKIITTKSGGNGYPLFQFYTKYNPKKYQQEGSPKDKNYKGFGKFIFLETECPFYPPDLKLPTNGKFIFIERGDCKENKYLGKLEHVYIYREDGTKGFRIIYVNNDQILNEMKKDYELLKNKKNT